MSRFLFPRWSNALLPFVLVVGAVAPLYVTLLVAYGFSPKTLDEAIATMNTLGYGNGATLFSASGAAARQFTREIQCGMLGINIGVPAPMALFSFSGWNQSFFGDRHVQGIEGVMFYTRQRVVLSRWDKSYVRAQGW